MRIKAVLFLVFLAVSTLHGFADALESGGLKVVSKAVVNGQTQYVIKDEKLGEFSIVAGEPPSEGQVRDIVKLKDMFLGWKLLKIKSMTFMSYPSELEVNVKPTSFPYKGVELATYITAGLGFFQTNFTTYNFRLFINYAYPRISGKLVSEEELAEAILAAIRDPKNNQVKEAAVPPPAVPTPAPTVPPPAPAVPTPPPTPTPDAVTKADLDTLRQRLDGYEKQIASLKADLEKLRRAVLILHNLGIFGDVRPIDFTGVEFILKLKEKTPTLLQEDVATLLVKQGIKMTMNEIFLVFSVYFNEFK